MTTTINVKGSAAPADRLVPLMLLSYEMDEDPGANIIDVPGRKNPVTVWHAAGGRRGTVQLLIADEAAATSARALLRRPVTFALTDTDRPSNALDFVIQRDGLRVTLDPQTRVRYVATIKIVEQ